MSPYWIVGDGDGLVSSAVVSSETHTPCSQVLRAQLRAGISAAKPDEAVISSGHWTFHQEDFKTGNNSLNGLN